ncbi:MAG: hypothetical protein ACRDIZ_02280 [Actinomycetota bacterium]
MVPASRFSRTVVIWMMSLAPTVAAYAAVRIRAIRVKILFSSGAMVWMATARPIHPGMSRRENVSPTDHATGCLKEAAKAATSPVHLAPGNAIGAMMIPRVKLAAAAAAQIPGPKP